MYILQTTQLSWDFKQQFVNQYTSVLVAQQFETVAQLNLLKEKDYSNRNIYNPETQAMVYDMHSDTLEVDISEPETELDSASTRSRYGLICVISVCLSETEIQKERDRM